MATARSVAKSFPENSIVVEERTVVGERVEELRACDTAEGFLSPTLDPFICIWAICRRLCSFEDGIFPSVDRNTSNGMESRLNQTPQSIVRGY